MRSLAIIGNSLVHRVPKQTTLKLVKKQLKRLADYANLSPSETNSLWADLYKRYIDISKKTFSSLTRAKKASVIGDWEYEEELKLRKNIVYGMIRKEFTAIEKEKNAVANAVEYRAKRDQIDTLLSSGVFYLCSSHPKPAKDHADWEGKVYVNADWRSRTDLDMHGKIAAYIRNKDVKTVQWVVGEPVYLITRPNCKHYFIEISVEEVLGNSEKALLKKHNLYMEDEEPQSYEYTQYKGYYERLKLLSYLRKMFDAEDLDKDIAETRKLVKKWWNKSKRV